MNKHIWFKKSGWVYRPISWQGFIITLFFFLFLINVFMTIDRNSHSNSDTLYAIFPFYMPAFLFWLWLGEKTSD